MTSEPLDPAVQERLHLKSFEGKFDVKDFVGSISEKLIGQSKANPGPFDPKPFIQTFEAAVDKLIALRKDVQAKSEQTERSVKQAEREYSLKMVKLNEGFEAVGNSFVGMESKMNEVGRTAIRIGEQLESIHLERQRAQAAYDLIDLYHQFSLEDTTRIDAMKKEGREGRRQVAVLLRRLQTVAKEVDLPNADQAREAIDKYCEKFEKEMLYLFDKSYRKGDPKMMHHCAQTLLDFNGGAGCVQVYVNQHDFFINRVRETEQEDPMWESLPDPDTPSPKTESSIIVLFDEIRATVGQESEIVRVVFPNPPFVMQVFLQRVFAQSIQQQMERMLNRATAMSDLSYLRVLQLIHHQVSSLVEDLKLLELPAVAPRSPMDSDARRSLAGGPPSTTASGGNTAVSAMLNGAMEELFVPYTEASKYLDKETRCLGDLFTQQLSLFTRFHTRTATGKSSMFGRMMDQISAAAATTGATGTSTSSVQAAAALMGRFGGIGINRQAQEEQPEETFREEDGQLSIDMAEKLLKWHAEAIGRCVELSPSHDVPKHTFSLLRVLSEALGTTYVETALTSTLARLEGPSAGIEAYLQPMAVLRAVDSICHLWQQYVNIALFPLASSSVTVRREMTVFNNQAISRIEGSVNTLSQRIIDGIVSWLSVQLGKQKKADFKPRNEETAFARVNTEPCEACCEALERVRDAAKLNLSGKNLEVFLTEVGIAFNNLLLDHLRKFPVSATGGLVLAKDIKLYQDTVATFSIPPLHERYEFLRQLGNIFLMRPEVLKAYITENYLGRIDAALLRPYLAQRSDWGQSEKAFNDGLLEMADDEPGEDTKGLGRFARISMMMKDMEGLNRIGEGMSLSSLGHMASMPALASSLPGRFALARAG